MAGRPSSEILQAEARWWAHLGMDSAAPQDWMGNTIMLIGELQRQIDELKEAQK